MAYTRTTIFFFSGTGNSQRVARWLGEAAARCGSQTSVEPIGNAEPNAAIADDPSQLVGLVMPTHAFTAPWAMIRFALRLPRRRAAAFVIATRAAARYWPFPYASWVPGVAGTGPLLIALILALKGYRVRGTASVNMPSNWTALHPGMSPEVTARIIADARPQVAALGERLLTGGRCWLTRNNAWELLMGLALAYVSVLYLVVGRFYLARSLFATNACTGCGVCAQSCPVGAIRMGGGKRRRPFWRYTCESCMRCMNFCPENAIEGGQSWMVILFFVTTVPAVTMLLAWLDGHLPGAAALDGTWLAKVMGLLYVYAAITLSYYVFWWLLGFRVVNRLFSATTLTRFYRRYHEPGTRLTDLRRGDAKQNPSASPTTL